MYLLRSYVQYYIKLKWGDVRLCCIKTVTITELPQCLRPPARLHLWCLQQGEPLLDRRNTRISAWAVEQSKTIEFIWKCFFNIFVFLLQSPCRLFLLCVCQNKALSCAMQQTGRTFCLCWRNQTPSFLWRPGQGKWLRVFLKDCHYVFALDPNLELW